MIHIYNICVCVCVYIYIRICIYIYIYIYIGTPAAAAEGLAAERAGGTREAWDATFACISVLQCIALRCVSVLQCMRHGLLPHVCAVCCSS